MTACMLATNLGAKKTVARIDNYEYLLPKNKEFFRKLGVDSLIYPEMLAAKEIVSSMRMSWVRQWWEFCGGALILIGTKMREKAEILNIPLHQLGAPDIPYHVVAIKRGTETIIPRGDDVIKLHDIVYFTTTRKYIPYIRKIAGKEDYADVRNVMIMGGISNVYVRYPVISPIPPAMPIVTSSAKSIGIPPVINLQKRIPPSPITVQTDRSILPDINTKVMPHAVISR